MTNLEINGFQLNEYTLPIIERFADDIPGGFFIYHADGDEELIYFNRAMLRIFGCATKDEFVAHVKNSFKGIVHPDDLDEVEKSIVKQISSNQHKLDYVEYRIIQKDGTVRWIEDYGHFMHSEVYGDIFYVFIDDATDRLMKRLSDMEEINIELRRAYTQEEQFQRALLHDAAAFFEIDLETDEFTAPGAQLLGENITGIFDYKSIPRFKKHSEYVEYCAEHTIDNEKPLFLEFFDSGRLKKCYENGALEQVFDTWIKDAFGSERFFRFTLLLGRSEANGHTVALSIAKDITDAVKHRKLLEEAWKQAEIANVARNTFLNNISHDIKTPLNGILGYTDLMVRHIDNKEALLEYIEKIRLCSEQLNSIWDKTLEISNMESGKVVLKNEKCILSEILDEVEHKCGLKAEAKRLRFSSGGRSITHDLIIADRVHLRSILWQILDNAIKYTPEGGEITLSVSELQDAPKGSARYQFAVKDTGKGMHKEFLDKLFKPFERESNSTHSGVFGMGLGLPVAKNLVDLMGGSIHAESTPGKGSVFTVRLTFKLQEQEVTEERPFDSKKADLSGKRILLVEDNEINREITEDFLNSMGFSVDTAVDGADALRKVKISSPYDVILMDIQMPVMNGYESARAIRQLEDPALAGVPIIALSADAFAVSQEKSIEAGMNAHCPKPINVESLCNMISKILRCHQ